MLLLLPGMVLLVAATGSGDSSSNLVRDPSFSSLASWRPCVPSQYTRVTDVVRAPATAAMRQSDGDAAECHTCSQVAEGFVAGRRYNASAWIKSANITGGDTGASVCVEYSGKNGYISGIYPAGVKGATDWTSVSGIADVPVEATSVTISVYTRKGMFGTAF